MLKILNPYVGTLVNFAVVLVMGIIGSFIKKGIPKRFTESIMNAMGICVVYIGIDGVLEAAPKVSDGRLLSDGLIKVRMMVLSMGLGALIGEIIDIDKWINRLGDTLEKKLVKDGEKGKFAK